MQKKIIAVSFVCALFLLVGCEHKEKAMSLYITRNSPIIYNSLLYFYSEDVTLDYENISSQGINLRYPGGFLNNFESAELYYDITDAKQSILVSNQNNFFCNYISQERIEMPERIDEIMKKYDDFLIEKQEVTYEDKMPAVDNITKFTVEKVFVEELEAQYGEVTYNIDDFSDIQELIFIKAGCISDEEFLNKYTENGYFAVGDFYDTEMPEIFVGIIIKKDEEYYYGNLNNRMAHDLVEQLGLKNQED